MDYAVIEMGGNQHRVSPGDTIQVSGISEGKATKKGALKIDRVLMVRSKEAVKVGSPLVDGASVKATVIGQGKHKKILVFKKKKRKQYRRTRGHRQWYTALRIDDIDTGS